MEIAARPRPDAAPLVAERLSDRLAARLAAQLERGELAPGDRLPTEQQLAHAHGVSRTVVREAVHQLKSRGLLLSRQGSGVYVAPPAALRPLDFDPAVLGSFEAVAQVVEVRRAIEGEIAALAAERATRSDVATLRRALAALDAATAEGRDGIDEDLTLHRAIAVATGNPPWRGSSRRASQSSANAAGGNCCSRSTRSARQCRRTRSSSACWSSSSSTCARRCA